MGIKLFSRSSKAFGFLLVWTLSTLLSFGLTAQSSQTGTCKVTVQDSSGQPLVGASVVVKGTNKYGITDNKGVCSLTSVGRDAVLVVSQLGMVEQEVATNGRSSIVITMKDDALMMDEVVVIGYGVQRKKDLSGAIAHVDGDVINEYSTLSVAHALQGRVSGVEVSTLNGQPGAGVQMRIRGANSILGSNDPLYIINGFPGDINSINNTDIESVEVLKDASATAIYGSRGANGVVVITTKGAKTGDAKVTYDGNIGVQTLTKQIQMMDANQFMTYLNDKAAINGNDPIYSAEQIASNKVNTNWQDEVFRPAVITSHSVDITGGTDKLSASAGVSYFDQEGIMINSGYQRFALRTDVKYNISKYVTAHANVMISRANHQQMNSQGDSRGSSAMGAALTCSPLATPKKEDGSWNDLYDQPATGMNPLAYLTEIKNHWYSNRQMINADLTIRPVDGLSIQLAANVSNSNSRSDYTKPLNYPNSNGAASISIGEGVDFTNNNIITYDKQLGKHHINVMGGFTYEQSVSKSVGTGTASGFLSDAVESYDINAAEIKGIPTSGYSKWVLMSFLGRINYNYDNRYLVTASFRSDGSSRYSKGNKWGYFPSAAVAWRASQESFLRDVDWLSELKIRAGYGVTGSTAISPYSTQNTLSAVNVVFDKDLMVGYAPADRYLGDLRWESTAQLNAGVDFGAFNDRIRLTADYYYKKTTDLLNEVEMPRSSGYTTALKNIGSVSNRGFELQLDTKIIDSDFKWDFGVNFSLNRSKVLSLADGKDIFGATVSNTLVSGQLNLMREGEQMYLFYGYKDDGYDETGNLKYMDLDGDGKITTEDRTIIGNPNPDFLLSFNTSFSYKRFTLSAFFSGSFGNDLYSLTMVNLAYDYGYNANCYADVLGNYWTPENPDAKYPNILSNINLKMSDRFMYDGTYLRLKNLELNYDIPCGKGKVFSKAKVYVSGQNLVTFTSYPLWNPDVNAYGGGSSLRQGVDSNTYPNARSFTLGCKLVF